ncbi:MAG: PKD domain-containing protein [Bacteroidetes bacterium]|nr:PKD domain-containing protein [Bacteroidota bacterium]
MNKLYLLLFNRNFSIFKKHVLIRVVPFGSCTASGNRFQTTRWKYFGIMMPLLILLTGLQKLSAQIASFPYTTAGTYTWSCPSGITTLTVECWGGGGGGGGVATTSGAASGGGAGGAYALNIISVTPGTSYIIVVGAGGTGGANTGGNGGAGGNSSFNNTTVLAVGGTGGTGATTLVGAAGATGSSSGSIGSSIFAGGNGAAGTVSSIGGGGGGGAGNTANGGNASGSTAGTGGTTGGGAGATGVSNAVPAAATAPGGGGAGTRRTTTNRAGGAGGAGKVVLTYVNPAPTIENFLNQTFCTTTYPSGYNTVTFSLIETTATNFDANQTNQTLVLTLPAGFAFNTAAGSTVTRNTAAAAQDITIVGFSMTTSAITVTLTTAATQANVDAINFNNFQIRATAAGSGDLVRTGGTFSINTSSAVPTSTQSFGHLATSSPSTYSSSAVSQYTTSSIIKGCTSTSNPILEIKVNINGGYCTPNDAISQFVFNTTGDAGSTNPATDISKAEVYYADTTRGFTNANYFGSVNSPSGTFTVTGSQPLNKGPGPYYFYLTYTIPGTATSGNMVDAQMNSFTFNGSVVTTSISTPNPTGGRQIISGTCPPSADLTPPTTNTQTITAGSLIIPMDNTHQALVAPFNLKAYGLVHALLQNDIPVKWIIKSGKAKDAADFVATAGQIYPTTSAAASQTFIASAFAVDSFWTDHAYYPGGLTATQVMTSFAITNSVSVYQLTADVAVDVRYTLNHRPKIAVFSNGGNEAIQTTMLDAAGVTNYFVQDAGDFAGLAACYTFCSESHWDYSKNPDTRPVQRVMDFVSQGGNFLAQCAGIDLYENHQPTSGHFQSTNGVSFANTTLTNTDYNPDMAYFQYQGTVTSQNGTIASFWPAASSVFKPQTYKGVSTPAVTNTVVATAVHLADPDSVGSNVFYLGGHQYAAGTIGNDNGIRMYLNATLIPAHRPTAFPIALPANPTICSGSSVTIGPVCASGATYVWSPATGLTNTTVCTPIASPSVTTTYTVTGFNGGCIMGPSTMTVVVNPTPVMTNTSSATICSGAVASIPLTSNLASTYSWIAADNPNTTGESLTAQSTGTLNNTIVNTSTSVQTVIYTVTPTSTLGSCAGTPQTVTITVNPAPSMTSTSTSTICAGSSVNIPLSSNIAGATFTWIATDNTNTSGESLTAQNTATLSNTITNGTTIAQNVIYTVTPGAGGCTGSGQTVTVTVNPTPAMTNTNAATICSAGSVNIPLTSNISSSYSWIAADNTNTTGESLTAQSTGTINNTINNSSASAQNIIYTVTPTAGGCPGTAQTVTVTVNPTPAMTSTNAAVICTGATVNIPLTNNVGSTTFNWIATDNTNTTGESLTTQSTSSINNTITNATTNAQSVVYTVTPFAGACPGTPQTVTVTVNPTPAMTSAGSATICSAGAVNIALSSNVASSYSWIAADNVNTTGESLSAQSTGTINNTITNSSASVQNVIYTVTPTSSGGSCAGTAQTVTVSVNPQPAMTSASSATICSGNSTAIVFSSNVASGYSWLATDNVNTTGESITAQTTATLNNTITNSSTSTQNVVYTVTPTSTAGSCIGTPQTITVSVNPAPAMTSAGNATICSGNTTSLAFTSNVPSTYTWIATDNTNTTGESLTAQSTATLSNTITNNSTSSQIVTYTVTPTSSTGSCPGTAQTISVTVNPVPSATATPNSQSICSGNASSIALSSNVAGTTFSWTVTQTGVSGASASSGTNIAQTLTTTGSATGTVVYTITPTAGGCTGSPITATVTVSPIPSATATPASQSLCSGNTSTIALTSNVAGTTFSWTVAQTGVSGASNGSGTSISQALTATGASTGTATYSITPTAGACPGTPIVVTITVNPTPSATITPGSQTICSGSTSSLSLTSNVTGTTFNWTVNQTGVSGASASSGTIISQALTTTGVTAGTAIYTITPRVGLCAGSNITATVNVNPAPTASATPATQSICSGNTTSIALSSNVGGAAFSWTVAQSGVSGGSNNSGTSIAQTLSATGSTPGTATYTIVPSAGGCNGTAIVATVTVNPIPTTTATPSSQSFCSGGATSIALTSNVAGATFSWTTSQSGVSGASNSSGTSITQTLTTTGATSGTANYTITPGASGCNGSPLVVTVTVNPIPTATATPASQAFCSGGTTAIALSSNVAGATFSWTTTQTGITGASNSSGTSIAQTLSTTGASTGTATYSITPTAGSCSGTAITASVTVYPAPVMTSAGSATICGGGTVNIPFTSNVPSTYTWIATNNPNTSGESITTQSSNTLNNTITSSTGTTEIVVYTVTPTSTLGSCPGTSQTINVTISPTPVLTITPTSQTLCSGNQASIGLNSNVSGTTYTWTVAQSGVSGASAGTGTTIAQTLNSTGTATGSVVYTITPTIGTCSGSASTATVFVNPVPTATATPSSQSFCSGGTTAIALTSNVGSTTFSWTTSQAGVNGASNGAGTSIAQMLTTAGTSSGTATYSIIPTANSCSGTPVAVTITVNPVPSVTATPSSQAFCSGGATSIALTSNVTGATFSWTSAQSGVSGASNSSGSTISQTLTATTSSNGTASYTITPTAGTCSGSPVVVTVTVYPIPAAPTASVNSPVCITNTINLSAGTVGGATYSWSGPNSFSSSLQNPSITNAALTDAGTYSVHVTVNGCTGPNQTVNVVVNTPPPSTLSPASNSPVCTGQTLSLSIAAIPAASYSWSGPNSFGSALQNPSITNVTLPAAGVYTLNATVPGCSASGSGTVAVVINATPSAPAASNNGPVCAGATLSLTASNAGTSFNWSGPNTFTSSVQNPTLSNISLADAGVYSVTATSNGCTGPAGTTTVIVNPIPATPTVTSNSPLCVNQTLNLSTSAVAGGTYSWNGPNTFTSSIQNPSVPNVSVANAGTYSLNVTVSNCTSATGTVNVVINSSPSTPTASANSPVCTGDTLFLSTNTVGGATYSWTGPGGFTSTSQTPSITPVALSHAGTYTVIANNGCASAPATVSVAVNQTPSSPVAGNNSPFCQGSTLNLTASNVAGASYNWSGPNSFTATIQNPNIPAASATNAGTYSVTVTQNGCTSPAAVTTASVNNPAIAAAGSAQTVCANNAVAVLSGTISGGSTTGNWTSTGTGSFSPSSSVLTASYTPSNTDTAAGSVVLTLTSTNNGACAAATSSITLTISDAPLVSAGASQSVCANNPNVSLNGSVSGGSTTGLWTTSGTGTFTPGANALNATYVPSATDIAAGNVTFTLTSTGNGQCLAVSSQMTVNITGAPTVNAGTDQIKCKASVNAALSGTVTVTNTGIWSTLGSGTFTPNANTLNSTYVPSTADTSAGSVLLVLTSSNNGGCIAVTDTVKISYADIPAVYAGSSQTVCANNANVALSGTVTAGGSAGIWSSSGTGTFTPNASSLNATYIPSAADTASGNVTITLSSTNGCVVVTDNLGITITDAPVANAGANTSVCANNAVASITGTVSGATTTGIWSSSGTGTFSPSNTSMNINYTASPADITAGSVYLILTSTNAGTCNAAIDTLVLSITPPPVANAGNDTSFCANNTLVLHGTITGGSGSGIWTSNGSGSFSPNANTLNATYIPSNADTAAHQVVLTLTSSNNGGCLAATDQMTVNITPAPTIYAGADQAICANTTSVSLNGTESIASGAQWTSPGDGTFTNAGSLNASYTPGTNDITAGTATLIITSTGNGGCRAATDTMHIQIQALPVVNAGSNQFICSSITSVNINGTVSGGSSTGSWTTLGSGSFGNPSNLSSTYTLSTADTTAGSVSLVLTSTNNGNCNAITDTVLITVTPAGFANAGNDTTICASVSAVHLSGIILGGTGTGQWSSTGTGTFTPSTTSLTVDYAPSAADISAGSVGIKLSPINSCMPTADSIVVTIAPAPVVDAGTNIGICASTQTVALNGTVSGGSTTGQWTTTGSGTFLPSATTLNAIYQLSTADSTAGAVKLILTSTNNGSCGGAADSITVTITAPATANAGNNVTVCANHSAVNLAGVITGGTGQGQWTSHGNGTFAPTDTTLGATYTPGSADISGGQVVLVLSPINACAPSSDSIVVTITPSPTVSAGSDVTMCGGLSPINLSGSINTVPTGAVWTTNGNGTFSPTDSTMNAIYTPVAGDNDTLVFVLTTTGNGLCYAVNDTVVIFRNAQPIANFGYSPLCTGKAVAFTDSSAASTGTITSWNWDFGGGNTATVQNPSYTYSTTGTYTVSLHVSTGNGCSDSITKIIHVHPSPVSTFSYTSSCLHDTLHFNNGSSISGGSITGWNWSFGDGGSSTQQNPGHVYDSLKVYTVSLTVTSDSGCTALSTQTVDIHPTPNAGFSLQSNCGSLSVSFHDTSSVGPVVWNWSFGDGNTSTQQNPTNVYGIAGTYTVSLMVTSAYGCKDTVSHIVNPGQSVTADYIPHGGTYNVNQSISFTNQSTGASSYNWTFGDNTTLGSTDPSHAYSQPGTYTVVLVADNGLGCSDTASYVFTINTTGYTVPTGFTPNGDGLNDYFYVMGGPFDEYDLHVFNEWGNEVFSSGLQSNKWDGTFKLTDQPSGTYIYVFNGKTADGQIIKLKGEVNIIR